VDFGLTEEQKLLQHTIGQFLESECPVLRLHEIFDSDDPYDPELWRGMMELGLGGLVISEAYGGAGLELIDLALAAEVLGHRGAPGPFLGHALAGLALELGGSEAQKQRWLPALASGECLATVALCEADGSWDPSEWQLRVDASSAAGSKQHVMCGSEADLIVVGSAGGGLALVERSSPGVKTSPVDGIDRSRRLDDLELDDAPCEPLPGGGEAAPRVRDAGLCLLAADAFGGASRCVEMSVAYAQEREQFGVTIGHFQALKHQLANMAADVEPCRGLYWYAAHAWDALPEQSPRAAALAKAHVTTRFAQAARDAVEAHGGIGYTWEGDIQIWLKRSIFDRSYLGSPAVHRERTAQLAGW
jgi:alkylation response protein AidB-like acyl-CoA dehydrogenase